ncbi:MAG: hypothetical protein R2834_12220 [Rhodothermales bacterium]
MMIHVTALWRAGARRSRRIASVLSCWILSGLFVSAGFAQGGVPRWDDRFQGYGVDGAIYAMAMDAAGHVYVAGSFNRAGGLPAKNVAMWDGTRWSALGKGVGQSSADAVNALFFGNDGRLYAGGSFEAATQSDGVVIEANNLAVWDGVRWESLGSGVNDEVFALAGAANGSVYIGGIFSQDGQGEFDLGKVAVWDGNDLSPVGDGLGTFSSVSVQAFAFDSAGDLYAAGASLAGGIFKWDGATWAAIGAPHNGAVYAMAIDSQDRIYVGGTMTQVTQPDASLASVGRIARWESTGWDLLAGGLNTDVRALVIDDQDRVYAGGLFTRTPGGGMTLNHVALWNDAWSPLGTGAGDDPFDEVSTLLLASDGALLVGGDVYYIDGKIANGFGIWRNGGWDTAGGEASDSEVHALAYDAAGGGLYAGGAFLMRERSLLGWVNGWRYLVRRRRRRGWGCPGRGGRWRRHRVCRRRIHQRDSTRWRGARSVQHRRVERQRVVGARGGAR